MMRVRLDWTRAGRSDLFTASCGEEGQGRASVAKHRDGWWHWRLDMLPGDSESIITGHATQAAIAMGEVERQVAQWPALIEGARRD